MFWFYLCYCSPLLFWTILATVAIKPTRNLSKPEKEASIDGPRWFIRKKRWHDVTFCQQHVSYNSTSLIFVFTDDHNIICLFRFWILRDGIDSFLSARRFEQNGKCSRLLADLPHQLEVWGYVRYLLFKGSSWDDQDIARSRYNDQTNLKCCWS